MLSQPPQTSREPRLGWHGPTRWEVDMIRGIARSSAGCPIQGREVTDCRTSVCAPLVHPGPPRPCPTVSSLRATMTNGIWPVNRPPALSWILHLPQESVATARRSEALSPSPTQGPQAHRTPSRPRRLRCRALIPVMPPSASTQSNEQYGDGWTFAALDTSGGLGILRVLCHNFAGVRFPRDGGTVASQATKAVR